MPDMMSKLEGVIVDEALDSNQQIGVIVKVIPAGYIPDGATVRAQISPNIFTCVVPHSYLANLEKDKNVQSFSISQHLYPN